MQIESESFVGRTFKNDGEFGLSFSKFCDPVVTVDPEGVVLVIAGGNDPFDGCIVLTEGRVVRADIRNCLVDRYLVEICS